MWGRPYSNKLIKKKKKNLQFAIEKVCPTMQVISPFYNLKLTGGLLLL
jgi:hypothetical protein